MDPLREALRGHDAWISAIRRDQTRDRAGAAAVERDPRYGLVKVNPLLAWSAEDVWAYLRERDVPVNPLHAAGYPSIGCQPCTTPVDAGEDPRAGRWRGREKTECGLHARPRARRPEADPLAFRPSPTRPTLPKEPERIMSLSTVPSSTPAPETSSAPARPHLVAPHGGTLVDRIVDDPDALRAEAEALPSLRLDAREIADLELIATGAASPLTGFLGARGLRERRRAASPRRRHGVAAAPDARGAGRGARRRRAGPLGGAARRRAGASGASST